MSKRPTLNTDSQTKQELRYTEITCMILSCFLLSNHMVKFLVLFSLSPYLHSPSLLRLALSKPLCVALTRSGGSKSKPKKNVIQDILALFIPLCLLMPQTKSYA